MTLHRERVFFCWWGFLQPHEIKLFSRSASDDRWNQLDRLFLTFFFFFSEQLLAPCSGFLSNTTVHSESSNRKQIRSGGCKALAVSVIWHYQEWTQVQWWQTCSTNVTDTSPPLRYLHSSFIWRVKLHSLSWNDRLTILFSRTTTGHGLKHIYGLLHLDFIFMVIPVSKNIIVLLSVLTRHIYSLKW